MKTNPFILAPGSDGKVSFLPCRILPMASAYLTETSRTCVATAIPEDAKCHAY